jgi:hypothetical protein
MSKSGIRKFEFTGNRYTRLFFYLLFWAFRMIGKLKYIRAES